MPCDSVQLTHLWLPVRCGTRWVFRGPALRCCDRRLCKLPGLIRRQTAANILLFFTIRTFPVLTLWSRWWGTPGFRWFWCSWQTCRCCWSPPSGPSVGWRCRSHHRLECTAPQHNTPEQMNAIKQWLLHAWCNTSADKYRHLETLTFTNGKRGRNNDNKRFPFITNLWGRCLYKVCTF